MHQESAAQFVKSAVLVASLLLLRSVAVADPAAGGACPRGSATPQADKQLLRDFFSFKGTDAERAERFLTNDYIQHNPRLLRMNAITGATGRQAWLKGFHEALRRGIDIVDLGNIRLDEPVIVMAECDLVTAIYKGHAPDPDHPGQTYEVFAFETFRVRDGKFAEHWDQASLKSGWMEPHPAAQRPASKQ